MLAHFQRRLSVSHRQSKDALAAEYCSLSSIGNFEKCLRSMGEVRYCKYMLFEARKNELVLHLILVFV